MQRVDCGVFALAEVRSLVTMSHSSNTHTHGETRRETHELIEIKWYVNFDLVLIFICRRVYSTCMHLQRHLVWHMWWHVWPSFVFVSMCIREFRAHMNYTHNGWSLHNGRTNRSVCVCNAKYWSIVTLLLYAQCTRYTMLFRVGLPTRPTKMPTSYFNVRFWTRSITQRVISTLHSGQNGHSCSGMQSGVWRAMAGLVVLMLVVGLPLSVLRLLCNTTHSFRANAPLGTNKRWSQYIAPPSTRSM